MARRRGSKANDNHIAMLLELPWQVTLILAVILFSVMKWFIPMMFKSPVLLPLAGVSAVFAPFAGVSFLVIAGISFLKNRSKPVAIVATSPRDIRPPVADHKVVWSMDSNQWGTSSTQDNPDLSRDNTQWGYSSFQSNPIGGVKAIRPTSWSIELLQQIEWKLFEDISAAFYKEKGIRAELKKLGADGGIDIKLYQDDSGRPTSLVQCKAWNSKQVGVKEIREFLGVLSHEKISKGFYMASGVYSVDAKEFAKSNSITLIDGVMLLAMIQRLPADAQQRLLDLATEGDYTTPSCPSCGVKMLRRSGNRGDFWGCKNYPRCRQRLHVKSGQ